MIFGQIPKYSSLVIILISNKIVDTKYSYYKIGDQKLYSLAIYKNFWNVLAIHSKLIFIEHFKWF